MSAIEFPEYLRRIQDSLNEVIASGPAREHKHLPDGIIVTLPPTLEQVIDEILNNQGS